LTDHSERGIGKPFAQERIKVAEFGDGSGDGRGQNALLQRARIGEGVKGQLIDLNPRLTAVNIHERGIDSITGSSGHQPNDFHRNRFLSSWIVNLTSIGFATLIELACVVKRVFGARRRYEPARESR
jgi:hypothetical protein